MRRVVAIAIGVVVLGVAAYQLAMRETTAGGKLLPPTATATIGSGEDAVAVGPNAEILPWLPLPDDAALPALPLSEPPKSGRLAGPVREQALVLGAAPPELRPHVAASSYGETGVDVELRTGIELRFGTAARAQEKWQAAAAILADPSITALDYVNLHAPRHASVGGSGHELPPLP